MEWQLAHLVRVGLNHGYRVCLPARVAQVVVDPVGEVFSRLVVQGYVNVVTRAI